ncbi:MAG: hypothetical protein AAB824_01565 [Patescibacteria group bacterium]
MPYITDEQKYKLNDILDKSQQVFIIPSPTQEESIYASGFLSNLLHKENKKSFVCLPDSHIETFKKISHSSTLLPHQANAEVALTVNLNQKNLKGLRYEKNGNDLTIFFEGLLSPLKKTDILLSNNSLINALQQQAPDLFIVLCDDGLDFLEQSLPDDYPQKPIITISHSSYIKQTKSGFFINDSDAKNCTQVVSDIFSWRLKPETTSLASPTSPKQNQRQILGRLLARTIFDASSSTTLGVITRSDLEKTQTSFDDVVEILDLYKNLSAKSKFVCILIQEPSGQQVLGILETPSSVKNQVLGILGPSTGSAHSGQDRSEREQNQTVTFSAGQMKNKEDMRFIVRDILQKLSCV